MDEYIYSLRLWNFEIHHISEKIIHSKCHFRLLVAALDSLYAHIRKPTQITSKAQNILWTVREMCRLQNTSSIRRVQKNVKKC